MSCSHDCDGGPATRAMITQSCRPAPTPKEVSDDRHKHGIMWPVPWPIGEAILLNPTSLLADALGRNLAETYRRIYGEREPQIASALDEAARLVIERIASSDALYHDGEHTALVTLCLQDILRGRRLEQTVTPSDWGHAILAALNHDIGYVRGICAGDTADHFVIDGAGHTVT